MMTMPATATVTVEAILHNRHQGHRDSTYAMLMQLVATNQMPECLHALEQMAWRDVSGFIRHFERKNYCAQLQHHVPRVAHHLVELPRRNGGHKKNK